MTRAKFILKRINSDKYDLECSDVPEILEKLIGFRDTIEFGDFDEETKIMPGKNRT